MNKRNILFLCALSLAAAAARADEPATAPAKPWKSETEASLVSTNGNTKATTASGKETYNYTKSKTSLELIGGGLTASDKGQTTAEKYFASEKVSYNLSERNYTFERVGWNKDRFAGFRNQWDNSIGLGRDLIKTPNDQLIGELGGGFVDEEPVNQDRNTFASGRAYAKYTHKISETSQFTQSAEYLHNFENKEDFRVNTETALIAALSKHFSLKASYLWKYVGVPPAGFGRSDTQTLVSLLAVY